MTSVRLTATHSGYGKWHLWLLGDGGVPDGAVDLGADAVVPRSIAHGQLSTLGVVLVEAEPNLDLEPAGTVYRADFRKSGSSAPEQLVFTIPRASVAVTLKALAANVATLTVGEEHGWVVGQSVVVAGVDATFNGTRIVTAVGATTVSFALVAANVASVAATGTVSVTVVDATDYIAEIPGALPSGPLVSHLNDGVDAHDASAISFVPGGTVAATTVQAAIDEVAAEAAVGSTANVRFAEEFGADPTGVADSQPAFMAAIAALPAPSGGIIYALGTKYRLSKMVFWDDRCVTIIGKGRGVNPNTGTTIQVDPGISGFQFIGGPAGNGAGSGLENLHIVNTDAAAGSNFGVSGSASRFIVRNVTTEGFGGNGFQVVSNSGRAAPTGLAATPVVGGGTFAAATYYYRLVAVSADAGGGDIDSVASVEVSAVVAANGSVNLTWPAYTAYVPIAYNLYRSTVSGGQKINPSLVARLGSAVLAYTDTGTGTIGGFCTPVQGHINANLFLVEHLRTRSNKRNGFYSEGGDSNVGIIIGLDSMTNGEWGAYERSQLGNTYYSPHFAINTAGDFRFGAVTSRHRVFAAYHEDASQIGVQFDVFSHDIYYDAAILNPKQSDGTDRVNDLAGTAGRNIVNRPGSGQQAQSRLTVGDHDTPGGGVDILPGSTSWLLGHTTTWRSPDNTKSAIGQMANDGVLQFAPPTGGKVRSTRPIIANEGLLNSGSAGSNAITWGTGAPSGVPASGINAKVGDFYFRTDTPGVVGQRLYVCTVGGANPTWVPVDSSGGAEAPNVQKFEAAGTVLWTKPAGCTTVKVEVVGGGAGGGSGRKGAAATARSGGGGGGGGGYSWGQFLASTLPATVSLTVGAAGVGGAAQTVDSTNGNAGTAGGSSFFGASAAGVIVGAPGGSPGGGGGSGVAGTAGAAAGGLIVGGTGGAGSATGGVGVTGPGAGMAAGGGGGGGITTANAASSGGGGGASQLRRTSTPPVAGTPGVAGGDASFATGPVDSLGVNGGAGGGAADAGGGVGGLGLKGSGGGGGGAATDATGNSGAGGNGGVGAIWITAW